MNRPFGQFQRANVVALVALLCSLFWGMPDAGASGRITLNLQDVPLADVMNMLSREERANIVVSGALEGRVSVNLYQVTLEEAVRAIAGAAGQEVEFHDGTYYILSAERAGKSQAGTFTTLRSFKIQYSNPNDIEAIVKPYLSPYGRVSVFKDRTMLVVQDKPSYVDQIETLLSELDREPRQIMIQAKILQVSLTDEEKFGIDWKRFFTSKDGKGSFGVRGRDFITSGLFFTLANSDVEVRLDTLKNRNRISTLSSPKLLALEDREAAVIIGDRTGYKVTTTINLVTNETIEFLESGVILRVKPSVDRFGRVRLQVHPEVSKASVDQNTGIPSLNTSEVTTEMLVDSGQTVFIAGLITNEDSAGRNGVPVLGDIPLIGNLFTNKSKLDNNKETIVLISPEIVDPEHSPWHRKDIPENNRQIDDVLTKERALDQRRRRNERQLNEHINNDFLFDRAYER